MGQGGRVLSSGGSGFALTASNDGFDCTGDCGTRDVGLGILILSSVGSQIEAAIAASKINAMPRRRQPLRSR
jgi:hypothetical protein